MTIAREGLGKKKTERQGRKEEIILIKLNTELDFESRSCFVDKLKEGLLDCFALACTRAISFFLFFFSRHCLRTVNLHARVFLSSSEAEEVFMNYRYK